MQDAQLTSPSGRRSMNGAKQEEVAAVVGKAARYYGVACLLGLFWPAFWLLISGPASLADSITPLAHGALLTVISAAAVRSRLHRMGSFQLGVLAYALGAVLYGLSFFLINQAGYASNPLECVLGLFGWTLTAWVLAIYFGIGLLPVTIMMVRILRAVDR